MIDDDHQPCTEMIYGVECVALRLPTFTGRGLNLSSAMHRNHAQSVA